MKNNRMSRILKLGLVLLILFLFVKMISSCFYPKSDLQIIRAVKVQRGDLEVHVTATGTVKPYNRVEIKPPIAGRIEEVLVKEGENVQQGQILAWMSSTERAALLDAARAQGDEAFKRWQEAYKPAPLMAPLAGMVIVRSVEPGQTVTTADPVVVISDKLIVEALVDETDLSFIKLAQKTEISLDAYPDQVFAGKVDHITFESKLVNNVNVYEIDVVPENVPPAFRSGMTANIIFIAKDHDNVLLVPSEAIAQWPATVRRPEGAEFAVYKKVLGGKLVPVAVKIGDSDGQMTEITDGLKEGAEILIVRKKEKQKSANLFGPPRAAKKSDAQKTS